MLVRASELVEEMVRSLGSDGALGEDQVHPKRASARSRPTPRTSCSPRRAHFSVPGNPPLKIVIAKDLFDILAEGIEECRAIGRTLALVVLKNS